jgi:hypothetical protein
MWADYRRRRRMRKTRGAFEALLGYASESVLEGDLPVSRKGERYVCCGYGGRHVFILGAGNMPLRRVFFPMRVLLLRSVHVAHGHAALCTPWEFCPVLVM